MALKLSIFCLSFWLTLCASKELEFPKYSFKMKSKHTREFNNEERQCKANTCINKTNDVELQTCIRKCLSKICYDEIYKWDELEEGEVDIRWRSFKGCVIKGIKEDSVIDDSIAPIIKGSD